MSLDDVRRGIAATTADNPKGSLDGPRQAFQIDTNDQLFTAEAYQDAVIAYRNGAPVLLRDVGTAIDGVEDAEQAAWFNGERAVMLDIQRQPGANTIEVVDAIKNASAEAPGFPAAGAEDLGRQRPHHDDPRRNRTTCSSRWC